MAQVQLTKNGILKNNFFTKSLKNNLPYYWMFTISLMGILVISHVGQVGMFLDGQQYATVAMHLAQGKGTFWMPYIYDAWDGLKAGIFLEQPQLGFFIESIWFKILGNAHYTERIFCISMMLITALLIHFIWLNITGNKNSWLAICIWILIPTAFWAYFNNVMEIVMGVFTTASILMIVLSLKDPKYFIRFVVLNSLLIFCALFTKGLPGLFTLSGYVIFSFFDNRITLPKALFATLLQILIILGIIALLYGNISEAKISWDYYINDRLLQRINNIPTTNNRFDILNDLFNQLLFPLILSIVVLYVKRKDHIPINKSPILIFFLIALSGVLPIMLTNVQRGFYIVQTFPLFAIGFALFFYPFLQLFITTKIKTHFKYLAIITLMIAIGLTYHNFNTYERNETTLEDCKQIAKIIKKDSNITRRPALNNREDVYFYFKRFYDIDAYPLPNDTIKNNYILTSTIDSTIQSKIIYRGKDLILLENSQPNQN
jgi:hypothetical protein